jgi:Zn-dependent protease with chaperone function
MTTFPKLPGDSGIETDPTFCEGIAAFQRGDFLDALAYFAMLQESYANTLAGIHAQMGMVIAYEKYGQPEQAVHHCQAIAQYPDAAVQQWAERAIASLHRRYPQLSQDKLPKDTKQRTERNRQRAEGNPQQPSQTIQLPRTQLPPPDPITGFQPVAPEPWQWRNAGRLSSGKSLGKMKFLWFYGLQGVTLVVFFGVTYWVVECLKLAIVYALSPFFYSYLLPIRYASSLIPLSISISIVWLLSPWLLEWMLTWLHGMQIQPATTVGKENPEVLKVLNQLSHRKRIAMPKLGILPTDAPLAFSYGHLPRFSRIVLSQGLLDLLAADEVAVVCAGEVAHILRGDVASMTLMTTVLQLPYLSYWGIATVADRLHAITTQTNQQLNQTWQATARWDYPLWQRLLSLPYLRAATTHYALLMAFYGLALLSGLGYALHWVMRLPVLWLSRQRVYYSDRLAVELTGNPNGLVRALLKIALGTAATIQQQGQTPHLLDSLELLLPLGHRLGMTLGSVLAHIAPDPVLAWDVTNPYRFWLAMGQAQPLVGDRLLHLSRYAQAWKLEPEVLLVPPLSRPTPWWTELQRSPLATLHQAYRYGRGLLLQSAPYIGLPLGLLLGFLTWGILWFCDLLGWRSVGWMVGHPAILQAVTLGGFSLAVFLWLNPFFPEITPTNLLGATTGTVDQTALTQTSSVLLQQVTQPTALPSQSQPVQLVGSLLGRQGVANLFAQDLVLQTPYGLVRLHHLFRFSPALEPWFQPNCPSTAIGQQVQATGWLRRGATVWLDLDVLHRADGTASYSGHTIWMAIVASLTTLQAGYIAFINTK